MSKNIQRGMSAEWWPCDGENGVPESNFVVNLLKLSKIFMAKAEPVLSAYDLTFLEAEILGSLRNDFPEAKRPSDIYKNLLFSSGGTTKALKGLENRECILIIPDEQDRRSKLIALTEKGKKLIESVKQEIHVTDKQVLSPIISDQNLRVLSRQLLDMVEKLPNY